MLSLYATQLLEILEVKIRTVKFIENRFPELSWLPVRQFLLVTTDLKELVSAVIGHGPLIDKDLPVFYSSLYGLLRNPNFNRFKFITKALLPEYQFPKKVENTTLYFVSNMDIFQNKKGLDELLQEDTDTMLQLMVFLKHKLANVKGATFYVVIRKLQTESSQSTINAESNQATATIYQRLGLKVVDYEDITEESVQKNKKVFIFGRETRIPTRWGWGLIKDFMRPFKVYTPLKECGDSKLKENCFTINPKNLLTDKSLKFFMDAIISMVS
uniref:Uncharacterized protein n=1 Tax=Clytia hemisphaerica TaxID=252671 RepID=A0A7M5WMS1_9CNID